MVAYDYDAQKWVSGPEAERLIAEQKAESLELEKDPAYLAFIAKKSDSEDVERYHDHGCSCDDCCDGWEG